MTVSSVPVKRMEEKECFFHYLRTVQLEVLRLEYVIIFFTCQIQKVLTSSSVNLLSNFKRPENNFYCQLSRFYFDLNFCGNLLNRKINISKSYQPVKTEIAKAIVLQLEQQYRLLKTLYSK